MKQALIRTSVKCQAQMNLSSGSFPCYSLLGDPVRIRRVLHKHHDIALVISISFIMQTPTQC